MAFEQARFQIDFDLACERYLYGALSSEPRFSKNSYNKTILTEDEKQDRKRFELEIKNLLVNTAKDGDLQKFKLFFGNYGCGDACEAAAEAGHLHIIEWVSQTKWFKMIMPYSYICNGAASGGQLHILKWMRNRNWYCGSCCMQAAGAGHLHILKWAQDNGHYIYDTYINEAARMGHLHILKWAQTQHKVFDRFTLLMAARGGSLETFKWLHSQGIAITKKTCIVVAKAGNLNIIKWIASTMQNNIPLLTDAICNAAARNNHFHIIVWAIQQQIPCDTAKITQILTRKQRVVTEYRHVQHILWLMKNTLIIFSDDHYEWISALSVLYQIPFLSEDVQLLLKTYI